MHKISLVVITKNEVKRIKRCFESVPFADEIIVVDSLSTDGTKELAENLGAKVISQEFKGYRFQKELGCKACRNDWVLILDADEALSLDLQRELKQLLDGNLHGDAYEIPRSSFHLGRWIKHGGWHPDFQRRLFHRERVQWADQELHETILANHMHRLRYPILHWGFDDLSDQIETNNRYSSLGALSLERRKKKFRTFYLLLKPWGKFLECYLFKGGFRDGMPGFIIAVGAAYSMFLKWAKLWEIESKRDR